ncbi:hypothetical protein JVU11DRAFT_12305 [Chiua virens]|nr:hypothetical protein JVU11DRAFT_12305 [Chiua virens]
MTNICQLELWDCLVDVNHWRTMASLPLLEKLRFSSCEFLLSPPGVKPETTDKLRFSLLEVRFCVGRFRPMVSVDARNLRTLDAPLDILLDIDFLPQSALTGLVLGGNCRCPGEHPWDLHVIQMRDILERLPDSIQMLSISIFDFVDSIIDGPTDDILRFIFASPAWSNFRHLRSLKLEINHYGFREDAETLPPTLDGIAHLTNLQSLVVECPVCWDDNEPKMPFSDIQPILRDRLGPHSRLTYLHILGTDLDLVDGEWSEVHDLDCTV